MDETMFAQAFASIDRHLMVLQQLVKELPQTSQQNLHLHNVFQGLQTSLRKLAIALAEQHHYTQTAQLETEAALHDTEARFAAICDQAVVGIGQLALDGQYLKVNQRYCDILGYDKAELLSCSLAEITYPDDLAASLRGVQQLLNGDVANFSLEKRYLRKDGQPQWANSSLSLVRDDNNTPKYFICTIEDITDRKRAEAELRQSDDRYHTSIKNFSNTELKDTEAVIRTSEERLRLLAEHTHELVCLHEPDGTLIYVSPSCDRLLGYHPNELIGKDPYALIHPIDHDRIRNISHRLALQGTFINDVIHRVRHKHGHYIWLESYIEPIRNLEGDVTRVVTSSRDITERKLVEDKIQASLREKEALLAEVHHRVKNNLHIISSLFYLQANRIHDQQAREILQDSRNRVDSMALVHESLYRAQDFASINFADYVKTLANHLFRTYDVEPDTILFQVNVAMDAVIKLDHAVPCGLIINELITNALKHGFYNQPSGALFVTLEANSNNTLMLVVSNNGNTLPAGFNLQNVQSMGLKLVAILVSQLRGAIEVEVGEFTSFKITFPA